MKLRLPQRRLVSSVVLAVALLAVGTALGAGFPSNVDRVGHYHASIDPPSGLGVWLVLADGRADQVTVQVADGGRWSLSTPANRFLTWDDGQFKYSGCERKNWETIFSAVSFRTLVCPDERQVNVRMGDLNDTFVASSSGLTTIFNVLGEDGADYIRTANGKDTLRGGPGTDVLRGGGAVDNLYGDADDDVLDGTQGADVLDCGDGTDLVQYQGRTSALNVTLDGAANDGETGENDSISANCENVEAWNGADKVVGSSGANKLWGRDGSDTLKGGSGNDRLYGGAGKDNLAGDSGNDYISGDDADDTISGGAGTDTIYGGAGSDTISVKDGSRDTVFCGAGDYDAVIYDVGLDEIDIAGCERRN